MIHHYHHHHHHHYNNTANSRESSFRSYHQQPTLYSPIPPPPWWSSIAADMALSPPPPAIMTSPIPSPFPQQLPLPTTANEWFPTTPSNNLTNNTNINYNHPPPPMYSYTNDPHPHYHHPPHPHQQQIYDDTINNGYPPQMMKTPTHHHNLHIDNTNNMIHPDANHFIPQPAESFIQPNGASTDNSSPLYDNNSNHDHRLELDSNQNNMKKKKAISNNNHKQRPKNRKNTSSNTSSPPQLTEEEEDEVLPVVTNNLSYKDHNNNNNANTASQQHSSKKKKSQTKQHLNSGHSNKSTQNENPNKKNNDQTATTATTTSSSSNQESSEVTAVVKEEELAMKKAELVESPAVRCAFKEFFKIFRTKEKSSLKEAQKFAVASLQTLPPQIHWRVYLELADLAKRSNQYNTARALYHTCVSITCQPFASQGWLEYSKLEEECGNIQKSCKLLHEGLYYCEYNENLLTRAIKLEERMGHTSNARALLARLKHVNIDKVWRTVLEGALLEARAGNVDMARRVLKYLMHHVPWYGPLYLEAYQLERDAGQYVDALQIVERGLQDIPRYGPLWFGAFRLLEQLDGGKDLTRTLQMMERSIRCISRELIWKVHMDAAQAQERAAYCASKSSSGELLLLEQCRKSFVKTILTCPENLRWKVWLASGRMELCAGRTDIARKLLQKSWSVVPNKGRPAVWLEAARMEEFVGDVTLARAILTKARVNVSHDWKIWLESVSLELRQIPNNNSRAVQLLLQALQFFAGTGRLWAALVQLSSIHFSQALNAVPKSGEVWCEGARIHLNPFSREFSVETAVQYLNFATKFTPQYGDGFLETLRATVLYQWLQPLSHQLSQLLHLQDIENDDDKIWNEKLTYIFNRFLQKQHSSGEDDNNELEDWIVQHYTMESLYEQLDLKQLELRCCNADPNYGKLWFRCRNQPTDTARMVWKTAQQTMCEDVYNHAPYYLLALINPTKTAQLLPTLCGSSYNSSDFVTGLVDTNRPQPLQTMSLVQRRKILFGSDLVFTWKTT